MKTKLNNEDKTNRFETRKEKLLDLSKTNQLENVRLDNNYLDEILKHNWLIDDYIARYGFVTDDAPENTLSAYQNAIDKHYPILLAVQMIDDEEIICYSYKTLAKLTSESGYVTNMNINDIKEVDLGNQKIPTLNEALDYIKGQVPIIVEIINDGNIGKFEQKVSDALDEYCLKYDLFDSVAVMSINPYTLQWFLTMAPWYPRILRSGKFKVKKYGNIKAKHLTKLKLHSLALPDYVCYNAKDLPCKHIKKTKVVGTIAYNVKSQREYMDIAKYCDNIIFDGFSPEI